MKIYLTIDFGSTYTKLTAIDIKNEEILATAKAITTIEEDIMTGFNNAYSLLKERIGTEFEVVDKIACSSAAGGLKMVAIGLVPDLTAEAAKKAALGAGARVMKTYSFELNKREIEEIKSSPVDIILLAGGTDGGNSKCILHNAKLLAQEGVNIPVVVAGNKVAIDEIEDLFKEAGILYHIADNVMPKLNKLDVEPAREAIRQVFMEKIVEAKGMGAAEEFVGDILMPTPAAVLKASEVLALGTDEEEGLGDLIVVDIGGATTDIHSLGKGHPTQPSVMPKGLEEPYAKRTVEGDLGMRYSSLSLLEAVGTKKLRKYLGDEERGIDVKSHCNYRHDNIMMVPSTDEEIAFDEAMAKAATEEGMRRHCGTLECVYTPMGAMYYQIGKDLLQAPYIIGTGGVIVHSKNPKSILEAGIFDINEPVSLRPKRPRYLVDSTYILSSMGLVAEKNPDLAVRIMKKYLLEVE